MHVVTIAYDKKQISNNIFVLIERQESLIDNLRDMQNILEEYTLDHNVSSFTYSILVIFLQKHHSCLMSSEKRWDFILLLFKANIFWKGY